jgi:hypothetical protein
MKVPKTGFLFSAAPLALVIGLGSLAIPTQEVRWESFVGNIRTGAAGTVGSGTGAVQAAGAPWVTTGGNARVDLASGELRFRIEGLVLADTIFVGTPGPNPDVVGTLVCDTNGSAGGGNSVLVSTPQVPLSAQGEAEFKGDLGPLPAVCSSEPDIAFLVRSVTGVWFAAAIVRTP